MSTEFECWLNFLANEKLTALKVDSVLLARLLNALVKIGPPKIKPYACRLNSRRIVVRKAMELGIDLAAIKHRGKVVMGRGLLDIWNSEYTAKFGDNRGTAGIKEAIRRNIKTKLNRRCIN